MSILAQNIYGLRNPLVFQVLKGVVLSKRPKILVLMETKADVNRLEYVRSQLNFDGCFSIDNVKNKGNMGLLQKDANMVKVLGSSQNFNDVKVTSVKFATWRRSSMACLSEVVEGLSETC